MGYCYSEVPPIINVLEGSVVELEPGEGVNLTCVVLDGFPAPHLAWYHEESRLEEPFETKKLTRIVSKVFESTSFECRAHNSKGAANFTVKVDVQGPGAAPGQIQHRVDGNNLELSWGSPQYPNGLIKNEPTKLLEGESDHEDEPDRIGWMSLMLMNLTEMKMKLPGLKLNECRIDCSDPIFQFPKLQELYDKYLEEELIT
uniref:Ig-like domain-containing protein n=1 Tax=Romanomermis culicivorax TaxID=13658 RepID=A0A915J0Z0_ROMCU